MLRKAGQYPPFGYLSTDFKQTLMIYLEFMQNIIEQLKDNLQTIYRKALDADQSLGKLSANGQGKFQQVFPEDAGFEVSSKRFQPYIEELAKDILALEQADKSELKANLPVVVKKMELLFSTLGNLQHSIK